MLPRMLEKNSCVNLRVEFFLKEQNGRQYSKYHSTHSENAIKDFS